MKAMRMFAVIITAIGMTILFAANSFAADRADVPDLTAALNTDAHRVHLPNGESAQLSAAELFSCCEVPGDANHDGVCNAADAVFLIDRIFHLGPPPPCPAEADANADCGVSIGDPVYIITYIFKFGPAPVCGCAF